MSDKRLTPEYLGALRLSHSGCSAACEVNALFGELDAVQRDVARLTDERHAAVAQRTLAEQAVRDAGREFTEVREAYRRFKLAILSALGRHDPWAITVVSQRDIVDLIHDLRRSEVRLKYVLDRLPLAIKYPWGNSYETCVIGIDAEMARSSPKEP